MTRVEVRLTFDGAVSAVAGTPEVGLGDTAAGEGWCRIITAVLIARRELRCQEFADSLVDVEGCWAVKEFPAPRSARAAIRARSGLAHPVHLLLGHPVAAVRAPDRRIAAQRVRAAAVTRMYQRGRPAPLPGIRVNGGVVKVASGSEPVTCGQ